MKNFSKLITLTALFLGAIAITIVSCKKDDEKTEEPNPQVYYDGTGTIGSNGGTIYFNDDTSPINGTYIVIPENAMGSEQTIIISQGTNNANFTGSSDIIVVEFEPDGLEFSSEVEVAIPYAENFDPEKLTVFYYKNGSNKVDVMPISSIDQTNKLIKFKTTHFSGYFTSEDGLPCPGTPTVIDEDGNVYNTVNIGGQCWMQENINVGTQITAPTEWPQPTNNNQIEKYCYEDDPANCETYGGLYLWEEYMKFSEAGSQGICPTGWRIPTMADFDALVNYSGGYGYYNDTHLHLKSQTSDWGYPGDNESGFTARPGNYWNYNAIIGGGAPWMDVGAVFGASDVNNYGSSLVVGFGTENYPTRFNGAVSIRCIKAEGGNYNQAPTIPVLNFPLNQADVSLPFTLQWSSTDPDNDPLTYDIYLSTNSSPDELASGINENTYELTDLNAGQTYYWKIIVDDGQGHQMESVVYSFNVTGSENLPPTIPASPSPENNATIEITETTLHWACTDPEQDPITYNIYFGASADPALLEEGLTHSSYPIDNLAENTTYYWKVIAKDDNENSTEGPVWSFSIQVGGGDVPVSDFSAENTSGEAPLTVSFNDQSANSPTTWLWGFGDGGTSTQPNPSHTYNTGGSYTVSLTASNAFGSDIKIKTNYIYVGSGGGEPCPGTPTVTDADGNVYNTVQIGGQCWMKENLRVGTRIDGSQEMTSNSTIEKYCYDDDPANCETYGGLYQWNEMMQYTTQEGTQGICPVGWHLPTDEEWTSLTGFLGGESVAGGEMKEAGTLHWDSPNNGATNSSGFTALAGGARVSDGSFDALLQVSGIWSTSRDSGNSPILRSLYFESGLVYRGVNSTIVGYNVRCLKD